MQNLYTKRLIAQLEYKQRIWSDGITYRDACFSHAISFLQHRRRKWISEISDSLSASSTQSCLGNLHSLLRAVCLVVSSLGLSPLIIS
jgi:hypothetical protein